MKKVTTILTFAAASLALASTGWAQGAPSLNEIVMNDTGGDDHEFVEICGAPGTDLSAFTFIIIEGEGTNPGVIDRAFGLTGLIGASGFYTLGDAAVSPDQVKADTFENGGQTMMLVRNFSGNIGDDIDTNDDCVEDGAFPGTIVDLIATGQGTECAYYGAQRLGPDTGNDGTQSFDVAGVARCGDCDGAWGMVCLAGTEPGGSCDTNNPFNPYVVSAASPGSSNLCAPVSVEGSSWGKVKGQYR